MPRRILVILGHPSSSSYCAALASAYELGARRGGHDVRICNLNSMEYDLVLHSGYKSTQAFEPALAAAQELITWAEHIVFVYPIWWSSMPALLKGFIDRVFLPGYAFRYRPNSVFWDRLLTGRSAHLIVTMDSPPWYYRWFLGMPGHIQMKKGILGFSGIRPVKVSNIGPIRGSTSAKREKWLDFARAEGEKA